MPSRANAVSFVACLFFFALYGGGLIDHTALADVILGNWTPILRQPYIEWSVLLQIALVAGVMVWLFARLERSDSPSLDGLWVGGVTALLTEVAPRLFAYHFLVVSGSGLIAEGAIFVVRDLIAGVIVGLVYARFEARVEAAPQSGQHETRAAA